MREVKTHHVQSWLEKIAREHAISKTTLKHVKNFLSGVFRHSAQQGYFDGANPVKLAEIPAFAPNAAETKPYHYIKTTSPDAVAAMRQFSNALLCSTCAPETEEAPKGTVQ